VPAAAVYVYGVIRAGDADATSVAGVEGSAVRTLPHAGLAALVSDLESGALAAAREVRAHWRVLEEASQAATVLPVRFGTVMESEEAVRERLLEPNSERLAGLLDELEGRVQLSLKGDYDEEQLLREAVRRSPQIKSLRERVLSLPDEAGYYDRIRLGELVAAEVNRLRAQDSRHALDKLEPLAVASHTEQATGEHGALNLAFLVERERIDAFGSAVGELGGHFGERIKLRFVGPLPPYSFAEAELDSGRAAWA
jgi:gas vesicle protein GvpL/GvpF